MAVHRAIGGRDPLPYPKLESDDNFIGRKDLQVGFCLRKYLFFKSVFNKENIFKKLPFRTTTREAQGEQPWQRLFNTGTLSSTRHQVFSFDQQAPKDSLDFLLKTKYDQHNEALQGLARTRVQKETTDEDHGLIF